MKVAFRLPGGPETAERTRILHFMDRGGVVAPPLPAPSRNSGGYYALDFQTDSFSVYAVVGGVFRQTLTASDENEYLVTVTYDYASGIPDDAELTVRKIKPGGADYREYVARSAETLGETPESVTFARAFDIAIRNPATGEEYQPDKNVQVRIELLNDSLRRYANIEVAHIPDEDAGRPEVLDSALCGESVEFDTNGFSVYIFGD